MKYQHILALALGIVAIAACQRENPMADDSRREIKFTATMAGTTKATATAFEEGDQIGLCIGSPVDIDNVLLTPADDKLVPEKKLYWPVEMLQKDTARFIAFYPYEFSTYAQDGFRVKDTWVFGIASAQYKSDEFALQDYMSAVTIACPADESVELKFKHLMSRFNLTIVDNLKEDSFRDVQADSFRSIQINGLYTWFEVNFAKQTLVADPEGGESYPCYPARMGANSYTLLLPEQSASPEIVVTLNSGKKMKYITSSPIRFVSGKQVAATLTLQEDEVTLSYQIYDWEDDATTVNFLQKIDGAIPNDEIWYTTTDGNAVELINTSAFDVAVVSNSYSNGKGVVKFADALTAILQGENYRNPFEQSKVQYIHLPESLETIQAGFEGCNYLQSIQFPSHLAYVPGHLVAYNNTIRELEFPETDDVATNWSNGPIAFCRNLTIVTGPYATQDNRSLIKNNKLFAFAGAGLKSYTIPEGVKILGGEAFAGYQDLEHVTIPNSVTEIGYLCFCQSGIKDITIPETVTYIGSSAFESCLGLKTVHIPNGTDVEVNAFEGCESLESFTGRFATEDGRCLIKDNALYAFAPAGLKKYTLPEGITAIESGFTYGRGIPSLTLPASLKLIRILWGSAIKEITCLAVEPPTISYSHSLENLTNLEAIYVPANSVDAYKQAEYWSALADKIQAIPDGQPDNEIWYTSTDQKVVNLSTTDDFGAAFVSNTYENGKGVITFNGAITSVPDGAFDGCETLLSIDLPSTITSIGRAAFQLCTSLPEISIPDGVTVIGEAAFNICSALEEVELPESLTTFEPSVFGSCYLLKTINIPNSVTTIPGDVFLGCTGLESFTGKFASSDNRYLVMDNTLIAFAPCGLESYTIPSGVTGIGDSALFECPDLKSLVLPAGLTTIGEFAFTFCSSLTTLDIPSTVTSIGPNCFTHCDALKSFTGKFATTDGRCLINDNSLVGFAKAGLTSYEIPSGVKTITEGVFFFCDNLKSIVIPASVETIEEDAFYNCTGLTQMTVLPSVPPVAGRNFLYNTGTGPIYVPAASVDAYKAAANWSAYANRIEAAREVQPNNEIWYTSTTGKAVAFKQSSSTFWNALESNTYENGKGILKFSSDVTSIPSDFLSDVSSEINGVVLPETVTYIGPYAFSNSLIETITLPEALQITSLYNNPFNRCLKLKEFKGKFATEDNLGLIDGETFYSYAFGAEATTYTVPNGVKTIWTYAFKDCPNLKSIILPSGLETIRSDAFQECPIEALELPEGLLTIEPNALSYCRNLKTITIPESVEHFAEGTYPYNPFVACDNLSAFYGKFASEDNRCLIKDKEIVSFAPSGLTEYTVQDGIESIGWSAFDECMELQKVTLPSSIKSIKQYAFSDCMSLRTVYILATVPPVGAEYMFAFPTIYVPAESVDAYKTADYWSTYADKIQAIPAE